MSNFFEGINTKNTSFEIGGGFELLPKEGILCWMSSTPALPWHRALAHPCHARPHC